MITRQLSEMPQLLQLDAKEGWEAALQIAETACCLFSADYVAVLNPEKVPVQELKPLAEAGATMTEPRRLWLTNLIPQVLESDQAVLVKDLDAHPADGDRFTKVENITGYATLILRPTSSQTPLAVLYLECKNSGKCNFDQRKLLSFAEQAQALLQNAWLTSLSEKLSEIREAVVKSGETVKAMIDWFRDAAQADLVTIFPFYEDLQRFDDLPQLSGNRAKPDFYRPSYFRPDDMAWLAVRHRQAEFAPDSKTLYRELGGPTDRERLGNFENREKVLSSASLPLLVENELLGILFFNFRTAQIFDEQQRNLLLSLSDFAAQTLKQTRERGGRAERHVKELRLLEEIDQKIKGDLGLEELLDEILKLAKDHIKKAEDAMVMIYDPATKELTAKAAQGPYRELRLSTKASLQNEERGILRWACQFRSPARVGDVNSEEWRGRYKKVVESMVSELDIPLFDGEQLVGALNFESSEKDAFSADDMNFLTTLSNRAVHIIKKTQAKERERAINDILQAGQEILGIESSKTLLERILDLALTITLSGQGAILLCDQRWNDLYVVAERGVRAKMRHQHVHPDKGVIGWVMRNKEPLIADLKDPKWKKVYLDFFDGKASWQLTVPILKNQNEVHGLIVIESPLGKPFTKEDQDMVTQMATLAEIALRNAEHYEMKQRLGVLHKVDELIIEQLQDPEKVLWIILEHSLLLTEADHGDLHLYQDGKPIATYFGVKKGGKITERLKLEGRQAEEINRGIVRYVADYKVAYRTSEDAQSDLFYTKGRTGSPEKVRCEIAVPLLYVNELIGVLNLESEDYDNLTEADVELMEMLAGQAVIAYQNALRYRQEQEATKRFQILRDVGQRLSEITNLDEVEQAYKIVGEQLKVFQSGWITIRQYDAITHSLVRKLHYSPTNEETGLPPHQMGEGVGGYIAQRWMSGIDRSGKAVVISDVLKPFPGIKPAPASNKVRALVSAPIFFNDKYYGSLSLSHGTVDFFKDKDIELIEGLAAQLGVTLNRLEVTQEKQEAEHRIEEDQARIKAGESMAHHAANVAHRYANTFTPVSTQADKLRRLLKAEKNLSPEIEKCLDEFTKRSNRAKKLNQEFKDLAEDMEIGVIPENAFSNLIIRELLDDVIADSGSIEEEFDFSLADGEPKPPSVKYDHEFDFDDTVGEVRAVSEQVKAILSNLINNARDAMPQGGKLTFKADNLERHVELRMTDTGPGISESIRARIFEFGFSTKKSTGFGLAIAQYYARNNGGDLRLGDSQPGRGATFILLLPRADHS